KHSAELTASQYHSALAFLMRPHGAWVPPVVTCSALTDHGVVEVWEVVEKRLAEMRVNGQLLQRRRAQAERWFEALLDEGFRRRFEDDLRVHHQRQELAKAVREGSMLPEGAAEQLLGLWESSLRDSVERNTESKKTKTKP